MEKAGQGRRWSTSAGGTLTVIRVMRRPALRPVKTPTTCTSWTWGAGDTGHWAATQATGTAGIATQEGESHAREEGGSLGCRVGLHGGRAGGRAGR